MKNRNMLQKWLIILFLGLIIQAVSAQNINVHGIITDETGETMIGVSVLVKGTSTGVVTDINGHFSLSVPKNSVLSISYIGYKSQEISINGAKKLNIEMEPEAQNLDEVVVVAYGQQKKVSVTGSMSSINNEALLKSPSASLGNAISGKLPGLSTVQYSGLPGADDPVILIRGQSSFNGSSPLILVDGVERSFTQIDPNEVADITVLKDASATAVYGVRGANGVILVTTKRGEVGRTKVSASTSWGVQSVTNFIDMANSYTYATAYNNARISDGNQPAFQPAIIDHFKNHDNPLLYPDIDWIDYVMKDRALQSQHNISVSGGNQVARYFVSAGFLDQDGLFRTFDKDPNTNFSYKRYNYRANLDLSLGKYHELSINLGGRVENKHSLSSSEERIFVYLMDAQPFSGAGIVDGRWVLANRDLIDPTGLENIVSGIDGLDTFYGQGYTFSSTNVLNADIIYKLNMDFLTTGLDFRVKASYNSSYGQTKNRTCGKPASFRPYLTENGEVVYQRSGDYWNPGYSESAWSNRDWYAEASFNYNRTFGYHNVGALLLYNQSKTYYPGSYTSIPYGYVGLVARATYDYKHRYMIDANMGYNGSENFAEGKRFGFFPSVSVGWGISEEKFWEPIKSVISYLKIRASVGTVGNDNCQGRRFLYLPSAWGIWNGYFSSMQDYQGYNFGTTNNTFLNVAREMSSSSPDVTWETAVKYNIGFDAKFCKDKIGLNVDLFKENRKDILISNVNMIQSPTAVRPSYINYGRVKNHGYEVTLSYSDKIGEDFSFTISPSVSYAKNKVLEYSELKRKDKLVKADSYMGRKLGLTEDRVVSPDWTYSTGHAIGARRGYVFFGLYEEGVTEEAYRNAYGTDIPQQLVPDLKNGDAVYVDLDGDGLILEEYDQIYSEITDNPKYVFSLNFDFRYKNFDFTMLWTGADQVNRILQGPYRNPFGESHRSALMQWVYDNSWSEDNPSGHLPRLTFTNEKQNRANSDLWYQDARYIRLKNLEIGYTLRNKSWLPKTTNIRFYLNGTNLLTFTPFDANDPENTGGGSGFRYPLMRVVNLGLKVNF